MLIVPVLAPYVPGAPKFLAIRLNERLQDRIVRATLWVHAAGGRKASFFGGADWDMGYRPDIAPCSDLMTVDKDGRFSFEMIDEDSGHRMLTSPIHLNDALRLHVVDAFAPEITGDPNETRELVASFEGSQFAVKCLQALRAAERALESIEGLDEVPQAAPPLPAFRPFIR